jgi:hypothetical protein
LVFYSYGRLSFFHFTLFPVSFSVFLSKRQFTSAAFFFFPSIPFPRRPLFSVFQFDDPPLFLLFSFWIFRFFLFSSVHFFTLSLCYFPAYSPFRPFTIFAFSACALCPHFHSYRSSFTPSSLFFLCSANRNLSFRDLQNEKMANNNLGSVTWHRNYTSYAGGRRVKPRTRQS